MIRDGRKKLVLFLIASAFAVNAIVLATAESDWSVVSRDLSRILTIGAAMIFSFIVIARQGTGGIFGRAYVALAIGMALWFAAEFTWGYYEMVLEVENPFPSLADAFWLSAYAFMGYHLFRMAKFYGRGTKKYTVAIVGVGIAIFSSLYVSELVAVSDLESEGALVGLAVSMAYPIMDAVLFLPAIVIVMNSGRGYLTSIPWIFIGWIILGAGDTLLGLTAVQDFAGDLFLINTLYTVAYLCFAAGIWWYNKYFIFDEKKLPVKHS
jgi:hypothetical protein